MTDPKGSVIECRSVWKIFGKRADEAMAAIKAEGLSKESVLERFGCVVGVRDASFAVTEGEIFCIMGLSGSGKSTLIRHINRLIEPTSGRVMIEGVDINGPGCLCAARIARITYWYGLSKYGADAASNGARECRLSIGSAGRRPR